MYQRTTQTAGVSGLETPSSWVWGLRVHKEGFFKTHPQRGETGFLCMEKYSFTPHLATEPNWLKFEMEIDYILGKQTTLYLEKIHGSPRRLLVILLDNYVY